MCVLPSPAWSLAVSAPFLLYITHFLPPSLLSVAQCCFLLSLSTMFHKRLFHLFAISSLCWLVQNRTRWCGAGKGPVSLLRGCFASIFLLYSISYSTSALSWIQTSIASPTADRKGLFWPPVLSWATRGPSRLHLGPQLLFFAMLPLRSIFQRHMF